MSIPNEDAVSPVIGVMLMLVVTIVIAAVVSGFAGGLAGETRVAPTASIDVKIYSLENYGAMPPWGSGYYCPGIVIEHLSGDVLPTKDLQIVTYFTNASSGEIVKGGLEGEVYVPGDDSWQSWKSTQNCSVLFLNDQNRFKSSTIQNNTGNENWFGNISATFRPGDILCDPHGFAGNYDDNHKPDNPHVNPAMNELFGVNCSDASSGFVPGAVVDFKILHKPSGKYVFDREVVIR
ncbi:MAG: type IV pilin N-terminal domain-containing protein [Methanoculleus chikugoensis]|jgi:hypothetical protein|nr:type IV pilin N-terminal domain-containing protein [Methanoculleus chikugoensis]NMA09625.1 type IV pilin [Methanomicrobiales archaeon]